MWDFSLFAVGRAMMATLPYIGLRLVIYFSIALLFVAVTGLGSTIGWGITRSSEQPNIGALYGALAGFGGASGILYWTREALLYLLKAGHIAVLVRHFDGLGLPLGKGQIHYGRKAVQNRFAQASLLFGLDRSINGVLQIISRLLHNVARYLPVPGLENLTKIASGVLRTSLTYVDEIILAYLLRQQPEAKPGMASMSPSIDQWQHSRDALVLYAQNYPKLLKNAVWLTVGLWSISIVIFFALLPLLGWLLTPWLQMDGAPAGTSWWPVGVALLLAWSIKQAVVEPVAMYALMQVYFQTIAGQQPDPTWVQRLDGASSHFRDLAQLSKQWVLNSNADQPTIDEHAIYTKTAIQRGSS